MSTLDPPIIPWNYRHASHPTHLKIILVASHFSKYYGHNPKQLLEGMGENHAQCKSFPSTRELPNEVARCSTIWKKQVTYPAIRGMLPKRLKKAWPYAIGSCMFLRQNIGLIHWCMKEARQLSSLSIQSVPCFPLKILEAPLFSLVSALISGISSILPMGAMASADTFLLPTKYF